MKAVILKNKSAIVLFLGMTFAGLACQKANTAPPISGVAAFTVINAIPNSQPVVSVINTSLAIQYFNSAIAIGYGSFYEYSPIAGNDTVYVVQNNSDTAEIGSKASDLMFNNILQLKVGGINSLFLCGADTTSPDYVFTSDSLPYYSFSDSVTGIRFINLSAGSNPMSINLEGSPNGSEVGSLSYKGITGFKDYLNNSTISSYLFVVRDQATGDSLTQFILNSTDGFGLTDPNNYNLLTFKNVTIAIYGSENNMNVPLSTMLIDNY